MDKTVGIIGLGIMGGAIARNLVERGWRVIGFDTDPAKCAELAKAEVVIVEGVAHVAHNAPILMTSLPTPAAVENVAQAIAGSGEPPRIVIELSTLTLADKLRFQSILNAAGHIALDCPLSGTGAQAVTKDLVVYASGERAAYEDCVAVFDGFARANYFLGPFGNGSKMKFVANLLVSIHNVATAEAFTLGMKAGLDPQQILEVVGAGAGVSRVFQLRGPMMVTGKYDEASMKIDVWQKDVKVIGEFAAKLGCPTPLFSAAQPIYAAAMAQGHALEDTAAVCAVLEEMARVKRPASA